MSGKRARFQEVIDVEEGGKFGLLVVVLVLKDDWCHDIVCRGCLMVKNVFVSFAEDCWSCWIPLWDAFVQYGFD